MKMLEPSTPTFVLSVSQLVVGVSNGVLLNGGSSSCKCWELPWSLLLPIILGGLDVVESTLVGWFMPYYGAL